MALPLVPIGLGALNVGSGIYSYVNRRRRGQGNAQALTGAALETAAGFAIPGGALGKGALGVGGRAVASVAASGTAGAAVDFASQKRLPPARPPIGLLPPASTPRTSTQTRVNPAPRSTGEIGGMRGNLLRARVAWGDTKDALREVGEKLFSFAKPADDLLFRQSTRGGIGASVGDAVGKLPPKVRGAAIVGGAALGVGLAGANLLRQYQNRPKPQVPGLPTGISWDVLQPMPTGGNAQQMEGRRRLESYIDQRIKDGGGSYGLDLNHPDFQRRPRERQFLESLVNSRLQGIRDQEKSGVNKIVAGIEDRERNTRANRDYAEGVPGEGRNGEFNGRRRSFSRSSGRSSNASGRSSTALRVTDNGLGAARIKADADLQTQRTQSSGALQQARIKADADIQAQQSQSSATRYQARIRAQADVLGKQIQGNTARYQADQTLRGIGIRAQADVLGKQIQGNTARYQADQTLRGVGIRAQADVLGKQIQGNTARYQADQTLRGVRIRAQADVLGKQIQGNTARYQADQTLRGVGIRAQADVLGKQIQGNTARYQADQTLRGIETKARYDYRAKSEISQNQLAGVRSQSFAAIAAAQANAVGKIHAEALKRRDPELDSISTVEEYEDYKRRKKLQRAKADLSF